MSEQIKKICSLIYDNMEQNQADETYVLVQQLVSDMKKARDESEFCVNCDKKKQTHNLCIDCVIKIGKQNS